MILQFIKWLSRGIIKNELTGIKADCDGIPLVLSCSLSLFFGNEIPFIICFFWTLVVVFQNTVEWLWFFVLDGIENETVFLINNEVF